MKRIRTSFFVFLFFVVLIITSVPIVNVSAGTTTDGFEFTVSSGRATITGYKGKAKSVIIPTKIDNNTVTAIGSEAFSECRTMVNVSIPDTITSIGDWAFYGCTALESVYIPMYVTDIGQGVFARCDSLAGIYVDSYNPTYDSRNDCNAVIETYSDTLIAGCKVSTVPSGTDKIDTYAFYGCKGLARINFPYGVTEISSNAFYACEGLTSLDFPDSVVTIDEGAFDSCIELKSVSIPESVTYIGRWVFSQCPELQAITVDKNNPQYDSRDNCNGIIRTSDDTLISGCKSTKIPDTVTTIGDGAFYGCSKLKSLTIPESVTYIGEDVFYDCLSLKNIYYKSIEENWKKITIDSTNNLKGVSVTYEEPVPSTEATEPETEVTETSSPEQEEKTKESDDVSLVKLFVGFGLVALIVICIVVMWFVIIKKLRNKE